MNERLRGALLQRGISTDRIARQCGVDPKTVDRWVKTGRVPHRRHREAAAELLGVAEDYLWPVNPTSHGRLHQHGHHAEVVRTYPDRASVPREIWLELVQAARTAIDMLVFSGTFLQQTNPRLPEMLLERAGAGVSVRLCFGDPSGSAVQLRDEEEGIGSTLGAKIRASLTYFTKLIGQPNCDVRLHNATLYASLFRFDDQLLINPHIWGSPASANPVVHVTAVGGDCMFSKYLASFDQIWNDTVPWQPDAVRQTR